ncbi:MAG: D-alanine--D-alanine ligase family protein [Acidobacteriota bacterium]
MTRANGSLRVGLVFGGRSVEHQISLRSARTVARGLAEAGHVVVPLLIDQRGCWIPAAAGQRALDDPACAHVAGDGGSSPIADSLTALLDSGPLDALFPIVHGTGGEDGALQGLAEMLDLPYVGTGIAASAVAMDKLLCKRVLQAAGLPVVPWRVVARAAFADDRAAAIAPAIDWPRPVFVKPCVGGSSVGVVRVGAEDDLGDAVAESLRFDQRVLIERGIVGREIECAVIGETGAIEASPLGEIVAGQAFYDYADKYLDDAATLVAPAEVSEALTARLRAWAVEAFAAIDGEGMARVDFLVAHGAADDGSSGVYVNEINTAPGFTDISMYPRLWALGGRPLPQLVDDLLRFAIARHARGRDADAAIRRWTDALTDGRSANG